MKYGILSVILMLRVPACDVASEEEAQETDQETGPDASRVIPEPANSDVTDHPSGPDGAATDHHDIAKAEIEGALTSPPGSWVFHKSGLDGAGFQNVIAASPFKDANGRRPVLIGADVAGIHRTVDGARTWFPSNRGLGDQHVASLMFSQVTAGKVYAAESRSRWTSV